MISELGSRRIKRRRGLKLLNLIIKNAGGFFVFFPDVICPVKLGPCMDASSVGIFKRACADPVLNLSYLRVSGLYMDCLVLHREPN